MSGADGLSLRPVGFNLTLQGKWGGGNKPKITSRRKEVHQFIIVSGVIALEIRARGA